MATTQYFYRNGQRCEPGICLMPDNYVTTLEITIRSTSPLTGECLKQLVQQKHEVVHQPRVVKSICVVRNEPPVKIGQ